MKFRTILFAALAIAAPAFAQDADTPAALEHAAVAARIAGEDLKAPLFLCKPAGGGAVYEALKQANEWLEPTRAFDDLFYVGNRFVGVFVLKTSAGLILFDSGQSEAEARDHIVPGLKKLGLDPADVRYVIVTHGHFDHFGGADHFQKTYGARVALSRADWDMLETLSKGDFELGYATRPKRDLIVTDGQVLKLGDTSITLYVTPGHTPGPVSAIVPAKDNGRTVALSLFGSVAFPATLEPTPRFGGQRKYDESVLRFAQISRAANTQGILNTHIFADGTRGRLEAMGARRAGQPNPFLIGGEAVGRYYQIIHHCLLAAQARPQEANRSVESKIRFDAPAGAQDIHE